MDNSSVIADALINQICYLDEISQAKAQQLAARLNLPVRSTTTGQAQLIVKNNQLSVQLAELGNPVHIDFQSGKYDHRRKFGGGKGQPLAKAIGLKPGQIPTVIDATAGFARDAFVLAGLGCQIRLLERNPVLSVLIEDAIEHALGSAEIGDIANRMQLVHTDAITYLYQLPDSDCPDVVYIDPMYPAREKSALVKKNMRLLHRLIGPDIDSADLLQTARDKARKRAVIKRPKRADYISQHKPTISIESKNTRYDVYVS